LPQALDTLSTWGAKYLSQIVWRKVTRRGRVRVSTGYRVRARLATSSCYWRASAVVNVMLHSPQFSMAWHASIPASPDEFYKIIVDKTPDQTRCDLFSPANPIGI
jgi:N6-adenosine-specific RNA methylase IME4